MKAGRYIKEARIKKGITQEELALKTNINIRTIQRIENDEVAPRAYSLRVISEVLELDLAAIQPDELQLNVDDGEQQNKTILVFLHLSGLLLLPALMIWLFEKGKIKGVREHGVDVINFQLSVIANTLSDSLGFLRHLR
jgi:transcriptional regulator with XRE-family HTH domain